MDVVLPHFTGVPVPPELRKSSAKENVDGQDGSLPERTECRVGGDESRKFGARGQRSGEETEEKPRGWCPEAGLQAFHMVQVGDVSAGSARAARIGEV